MELPDLESALEKHWGFSARKVQILTGGMNSRTWQVDRGEHRYVAKLVPLAAGPAFCSGLTAAGLVDAAGIPAGAAHPTLRGEPALRIAEGWLALLSWVDGVPLDGYGEDRRVIGATLGAAHVALHRVTVPDAPRFHWIDTEAGHLDVEDWVRPAVRAAVRHWDEVADHVATWGLLHADPAPDAFLQKAGFEKCGLIDWSSAVYGPLLFDLASAVMYVGGPENAGPLVGAYLEHQTLSPREVSVGLGCLLRFRWAVQADYFARRLATDDLTGIEDMNGNLKGLEDARRHLADV